MISQEILCVAGQILLAHDAHRLGDKALISMVSDSEIEWMKRVQRGEYDELTREIVRSYLGHAIYRQDAGLDALPQNGYHDVHDKDIKRALEAFETSKRSIPSQLVTIIDRVKSIPLIKQTSRVN
ncbi:hypothetical protein BE17_17225 [Sorangium cellulosum]|uniref:Uncharacterized protein n=1 Tax=Sorangium cellulosum TaxID=56 RepID=A0A150RSP3_SORCE|nr:hypothetical protein BE17_17225 [Sorangium cellulosum]